MGDLNRDMHALLGRVRDVDNPPTDARERVRRTLTSTLAKAGALGLGAASSAAAGTAAAGSAVAAGSATAASAAAGSMTAVSAATGSVSAAGSAIAASAAAGSAVAAKTSGFMLAANLAAAALLGATLGTGVVVTAVRSGTPSRDTTRIEGPAPPKREVLQSRLPFPAVPSPTSEEAIANQPAPESAESYHPAPPAPVGARPSAAPAAIPTKEPPLSATLIAETHLLAEAQVELRAGHAQRSLDLIDSHEASYPNGTLREERMATKVLVLCALARVSEARAQAHRFESNFPRSPLLPRVQQSCAASGAQ